MHARYGRSRASSTPKPVCVVKCLLAHLGHCSSYNVRYCDRSDSHGANCDSMLLNMCSPRREPAPSAIELQRARGTFKGCACMCLHAVAAANHDVRHEHAPAEACVCLFCDVLRIHDPERYGNVILGRSDTYLALVSPGPNSQKDNWQHQCDCESQRFAQL